MMTEKIASILVAKCPPPVRNSVIRPWPSEQEADRGNGSLLSFVKTKV